MSGLFGGGGGNSSQQEVYAGIQVSKSLYGACIPYIAGRQRASSNLLWYGSFQVHTSNAGGGKGGGGSGSKQYSYSAAWIGGLCIGPIQGITNVWHDKALVNLTFENLALSEGGASFVGSISGTTLTVTKMNGGFIANGAAISSLAGPGISAGTKTTSAGTGGVGTYTVNISQTVASTAMRASQLVWSGYPAGTPAGQQIPYDTTAYVASSSYNLGSSASMPNITYEVEGVVPGYSDANSIYDADPSAVFLDYLLDPVHGALAGFPGTPLTLGSSTAPLQGASNSYQSYVMSVGLLTSPYEDTQRQATDFIAELLNCTNSDCRLSVGTLEILPYADSAVSATVAGTAFSYTPNLTPLYSFTDDDYVPAKGEPPVKLTATPQSDTYNTMNVEYNDRSNYYNQGTVNCSDLNDIALYGTRLASGLSWHQITQATVAKTAGQLWLQKQLYEINSYESAVRSDYALLEPGDYIAHNDTALGLVGQVCQITQIDDDSDNNLMLTAREIPGVTRSTSQYDWAAAAGYFANYQSDPGAVQAPAIFVMPPIPGSLSEGITIGIAVCGQTANAFWLGCDVYCSVDGGTTYQSVGRVPEACRYGTLTANIGAVADPDTTSTLSIALANTNLQISTSVTHAEADSVQTPILVDTGTQAEVMSFGAAALVSAGNYSLTYLRRGLYGSTDQTHTTSDLFVRLDGAIFQIGMDPGYAGQTISFKFVSYNTWQQYGTQTLSGATAYNYVIPNAVAIYGAVNLIPRGSTSYDGQRAYKATSGLSAWDSDCVSTSAYQSISFSAKLGQSGEMAMGLVSSTGATLDPETNMDYCWYVHADAAFPLDTESSADLLTESGATITTEFGGLSGIFESGVLKYITSIPPSVDDEFLIVYDGFTVRYYLNGSLARSVPTPGASLYLGIAEYSPGCLFGSVQADVATTTSPTQFHAFGGAAVNDHGATKKGGSDNVWDGSIACSIIGYDSCHIVAKPNALTSNNFVFGLVGTQNAASLATYSGTNSIGLLSYAWSCSVSPSGSNQWQILEAGVVIASFSTPLLTDFAVITSDGTNVHYCLDDLSTPVRTTPLAVSVPLYGAVCFYEIGSGTNSLTFGPTANVAVQDTSQIGLNAATNLSFTGDDATYATAFGATTLASTYPGAGMLAEPQISNPVLVFTAAASQMVIITATGTVYFTNTSPALVVSQAFIGAALIDTTLGGTSNVLVGYTPHAGVSRSFNNINCGPSVTTSPSPTQQFALQFEESVVQGHTYVVALFCQTADIHITAQTTSTQIQVETIKR